MAPGVSNCHREVPLSISFSGSGFLATYQLGVAQCFLNNAPSLLYMAPCVLGASAGSLVAAAVVCEMNLIAIRDEMIHFAKQMKAFAFGPFNPSINVFHWLEFILHKHLPSDAHQLASGRLAVSMTRLTDGKHIAVTEFHSKEDVVQALLCSCFVPGYCGFLPPSFRGVHYMDGGFSSMQPLLPLPSSPILTICPFSGDTDICPADTHSMLDMVVSGTTLKGNMANGFRIINALYPMALESLEQAFQSGYKDAIQFLMSNDLSPYLLMPKVYQGKLSYDQNNELRHLENKKEEVEAEMKLENQTTTLTSFISKRSMLTRNSAEQEPTRFQVREPLLHFDVVKNVLLSNVVTYLSMFGLLARILSLLLLPLMLLYNSLHQTQHRLEVVFRLAPELIVWMWYCVKHSSVFFFSVFVYSFQKNLNDRVMPVILVLKWLKDQTLYEPSQRQKD
ncbi:patatin-like phospholipase domain-containing protein 2 [Mugil cephalus]|uniref:patatin-like phospholipase domain-containing protein 2 n=1 Tax=Mugil cephalus TaxID=48193 RepID=UPI001FB7D157|nr:patatin-like phospholipase domain-containing protein 2 [Mugil cephalus]